MKKENEIIDVAKYKDELSSLRRVIAQFNELHKWLLNTSLASLAFAFTVMFHVKGGDNIPHPILAAVTLVFLIIATVGAILIRGKIEIASFIGDSKGFYSLLPVLRDGLMNSSEVSEKEKRKLASCLDRAVSMNDYENQEKNSVSPYTDIFLIVSVFVILIIGLGLLCFYICRFLFGM